MDIPLHKVVSADEMARVEKWAVSKGASAEAFMRKAGEQVALRAARLAKNSVVILVGKGNKGGDGYVAAATLISMGFRATAVPLFPVSECSPLNQKMAGEFRKVGGIVSDRVDFAEFDLIIDALLGTGFSGEINGVLAEAIRAANRSGKKILSIDLPSGLNGNTGEAKEALIATETVTLGLPKAGLFIGRGWELAGKITIVDFGLGLDAVQEADPVMWAANWREMKLPPIGRVRHKYERGFVVGFGGSKEMPGAVKLSGLSALHSGAGIVKLYTLDEVAPAAPELICQLFNEENWEQAIAKAQAVFVGPGMGRSERARKWLEDHLGEIQQPCVIDADALFFLHQVDWPKQSVLTPHRGEMIRLLGSERSDFMKQCREFTDQKGCVLVLKGAPTFVLAPGKLPVVVPVGDPGMATAGSGDVLTGIISAMIAQGKEIYEGAILGVALHGLSGEAAAAQKTSYGYTASDLINFLPEALKQFGDTSGTNQ